MMTNKLKNVLTIFCALTILFFLCISASAINVVVNGKKLTMAQPPTMHNNRVMVPLRDVYEELGVAVFYGQGVANCVTKDKTITISEYWGAENYYLYYINDEETESDQPPITRNGKIMVSVRMIAESLGVSISWDKPSETVTVTGTIPDSVKLSKEEIDAANAFTLAVAREKAADNNYYKFFEENGSFWNSYPSYSNGIKSCYNLHYTYGEGSDNGVVLIISIDGEVSYKSSARRVQEIVW